MKSALFRLLVVPALLLLGYGAGARPGRGFVRRQGTALVLDGRPYRYVGTNYWYGGLLATQGAAGLARLQQELDFLKSHGIANLRVMVGAEGLTHGYQYRVQQPLQPAPGEFDEGVARGLDVLLAELDRRDMKAVLHFTNTWEWSGGLGQYLEWHGYQGQPLPRNPDYYWNKYRAYIAQFYTCQPCKQDVAELVRYVLGRRNTVTGRAYVDEPAVMAWELLNEPRAMEPAAVPAFEQWLHETAALVKSLDKNHLLTTGSEGDIASDNDMAVYERLHADPNIDYLTVHIWPKNWGWFRDTATAASLPDVLARTRAYVQRHAAVATRLVKPLVLEEFGLPRDGQVFSPAAATSWRDRYYAAVFGLLREYPVIAGCNFWAFGGTARPVAGQTYWRAGDAYLGDPGGEEQGLNSVFDSDASTWALIDHYAKNKP